MEFYNDSDLLDQHFLKNDKVIEKLIEISDLNNDDYVIEIGPGKGTITKYIAPNVDRLTCIELDTRLKVFLDELCLNYSNVDIIYGNVLNVDIPRCNKIITALPYSITEPFMKKMIHCDFDSLIMITGSTFANNIINNEITHLSLFTNCFFDTELVMEIMPSDFYPAPRTISSLIKLVHKNKTSKILDLFKNMYLLNDKLVKNCISEALIKSNICLTKKEAKEIVCNLELNEEVLNKKFEITSNKELQIIYNLLSNIIEVI